MKIKILVTAALLLCFVAAYAWFAGIDGKWTAMLTGPTGQEFPITCEFKVDGAKLTGTMTSSMGKFDLIDGMVKGDSLWFTADLKNMQIKNRGRYYAQGDSIALYFGTRGTHSTMKRVMDK
jgi:hypothetical protein